MDFNSHKFIYAIGCNQWTSAASAPHWIYSLHSALIAQRPVHVGLEPSGLKPPKTALLRGHEQIEIRAHIAILGFGNPHHGVIDIHDTEKNAVTSTSR